jgi:hypothetical protein
MVQHNDKWKKKATREYHRKHGTLPAGRGRGRGRGGVVEEQTEDASVAAADGEEVPQGEDEETSEEDFNAESGEEETQTRKERSKYSRRKIESNAWRFESEEPDPYLSTYNPSSLRTEAKIISH